jgi:peptide/nickel transport system permease protein
MIRYLGQRLVESAILLVVVSTITFALIHSAPGLPSIAASLEQSQADRDRVIANLGLNDPLPMQYWRWVSGALRADFGTSLSYQGTPVMRLITDALPNTLLLSGSAFLLAIALSLPLGVLAAARHYSWFDHLMTLLSFLGASVPSFWLGLLGIIVFGVELHWLPTAGLSNDGPFSLLDRLQHLILPMTVLAAASLAQLTRQMRSSMLDVLAADYVRTARAKGLPEQRVLTRHALKNALFPVITLIGLQVPILVGGAAIVETIFVWPGIGQLAVNAAFQRDYPTVMGVTLLISVMAIISNLAVDLSYTFLDPRVKAG